MGIFGTKKDTPKAASKTAVKADVEKQETKQVKTASQSVRSNRATDRDLAGVLKKPRVSEKAYLATEKNVYVFEVAMDATKHDVRDAVKVKYDVTPAKINVVKQDARSFLSRSKGRKVTVKGLKKAYVYLKAGDKIELV